MNFRYTIPLKRAAELSRLNPQVLHFEEWSNQLIEYFTQSCCMLRNM
jgi:hypothetical protein